MTDKLKPAPLAYQNTSFINSPDGRILRILAEYQEPLARFRREQIQDTVVFFGSARFQGGAAAKKHLTAVKENGSKTPVAQQEKDLKSAVAAVDMARYYEDARRLAHLLTKWSIQIPARRRRFVVDLGVLDRDAQALRHLHGNRAVDKPPPEPVRDLRPDPAAPGAVGGGDRDHGAGHARPPLAIKARHSESA